MEYFKIMDIVWSILAFTGLIGWTVSVYYIMLAFLQWAERLYDRWLYKQDD